VADTTPSAHEKLDTLRRLLAELGGAVIAFSGGVDSTFLLKVAHDTLGDRALAVTARSETYPPSEAEEAINLAKQLGARHLMIDTSELSDERFAANPPDRCYYCKSELFEKLTEIARSEGLAVVVDGANHDDLDDFRPGRQAGCELGVRSPLLEVGLTKQEIRDLSREMELPTWDKPSNACLASRFPYGDRITEKQLVKLDIAEKFLRALGLSQVRVRHHGNLARIEVGADDIAKLADFGTRRLVVQKLKDLGYTYVTLDLQGYRTGAMNEALPPS
jgi:pyridinium-3,5-biscarboxylic acid mononucleotide sulfurtransferase